MSQQLSCCRTRPGGVLLACARRGLCHNIVNIVPWSVIISCGNLCSFHAPCQQFAQTCSAVCFFVLRMKCAIPEYQSTITRIASKPLTGSSFVMWSIATNFQIFCGRCISARSPLWTSCVFFWHFWQFLDVLFYILFDSVPCPIFPYS